MSIYNNLTDFARCPDTGEGWESARVKAEAWRDSLEEMVEVASPNEREAINLLLRQLHLFFSQYQIWFVHRR